MSLKNSFDKIKSKITQALSGGALAGRSAHYLQSGKDPVIFSIHSVCLSGRLSWWGSGRMGEEKGRPSKQEGGMESWSLDGGWETAVSQMRGREENQTEKKGCCRELSSMREAVEDGKSFEFKRCKTRAVSAERSQ